MELLKLYLKFFLVVAIIYSILMLGLDLLSNREISLNGILSRILIFGMGMSLILVSFHKYLVQNTAKEYGLKNPDYNVVQKRVFYSDKSPQQIYDTINKRSQYRKIDLLEGSQTIKIRTGFSGKSWGDKVIINSTKEKENYKYEVHSKPSFPLTVIDFGQNLENVLKIERYSRMPINV